MGLSAEGRARTVAQWMRDNKTPTPFTRADLVAALAAVDDWLDANQASYNQALPQPFRSAATVDQKYDVLMYVLMRRRNRLRAEEDG